MQSIMVWTFGVLFFATLGSFIFYLLHRRWRGGEDVVDEYGDPATRVVHKPFSLLGLTKSDFADAGRWMHHKFARWFASSFVLAVMFCLVIAGIVVGMYFDGAYAVRWAPEPRDESVFRIYGWLISLGMVVLTSAGVLAFRKGAWFSGMIATTAGLYFLSLSLLQSIGFISLTAERMAIANDAYVQTEANQAQTTAALILELEGQRDELNKIVSERTGELTGEIGQYITDGQANDERADSFADRRTEEQKRQDAELAALNARILCLKGDDSECTEAQKARRDAAPVAEEPRRYDPAVEVLGFRIHGPDVTIEEKDRITINFMIFWSIGTPIIGLMLSVFLMITRHKTGEKTESPWKPFKQKTWAERAQFWRQIPKEEDDGLIRETYTQEEYDWLMKAKEHRANYERGQNIKSRIPIENKGWLKKRKLEILGLHESGQDAAEIAETLGMTEPEFTGWVEKFFKPHMAGRILGTAADDPRAKGAHNGNDGS